MCKAILSLVITGARLLSQVRAHEVGTDSHCHALLAVVKAFDGLVRAPILENKKKEERQRRDKKESRAICVNSCLPKLKKKIIINRRARHNVCFYLDFLTKRTFLF